MAKRRKNRAFNMSKTSNSKFTADLISRCSPTGESDTVRDKMRRSWGEYPSGKMTTSLAATMQKLALQEVRSDHELDDIPDEWYEYDVTRSPLGDYHGEALHHGPISEGARLGFYDSLIYEEVHWFDSRFEAEAWAFTRAWLAFGSCDTFVAGVRYSKRARRFFAFVHEYE